MMKCWHGFWHYGIYIYQCPFWDFKRKQSFLCNFTIHHFLLTVVRWIKFSLDTTLLCEPGFQSTKNCCILFHLSVIWLKHQHFLRWPHQNVLRRKVTECVVCSSGGEKVTVLLSANKCQQMLPPMIIFRGKTDQTIRNLIIPPGFIVKTHEKP